MKKFYILLFCCFILSGYFYVGEHWISDMTNFLLGSFKVMKLNHLERSRRAIEESDKGFLKTRAIENYLRYGGKLSDLKEMYKEKAKENMPPEIDNRTHLPLPKFEDLSEETTAILKDTEKLEEVISRILRITSGVGLKSGAS